MSRLDSSLHEEGRTHCWGDWAGGLGGDLTGLRDSVRRVQAHGFPTPARTDSVILSSLLARLSLLQNALLKEAWAALKWPKSIQVPAPPYLPLFSSHTWDAGVLKPAIRQGLSLGEAKPSSSFVISFQQDFNSASGTPVKQKGKRGSLA